MLTVLSINCKPLIDFNKINLKMFIFMFWTLGNDVLEKTIKVGHGGTVVVFGNKYSFNEQLLVIFQYFLIIMTLII